MKICLINPPIEDFYITRVRRQPLGLLYIAACLRDAGYTPELLNCHSVKKSILNLPEEFNYLKKYILHPEPEFRFPFRDYSHYGMSWQEIESRIKNIRADIYFISSLFTTYYQETEKVISIIRKHSKNAVIAVGGYHPSLHTEYFLRETETDYVIKGEGEIAAATLVKVLDRGGVPENVPGVISRMSKNDLLPTGESPDINMLPLPARDMLLQRDFNAYRNKFVSMITSRGCPNRCRFCTGKTVWGNRYRGRDVSAVIHEIIECNEKYGAGIINFEDDNLFPSQKRAMALLSEIIAMKKSKGIEVEFTAMNGISLERIDEKVISFMKEAGFRNIDISLVSQSSEVQEMNFRPFDSDKFRRIAEEAKKNGLKVRGYFILGMPGQDREEIEETIKFMKGLEILVFPSVFYNVFTSREEWKMQRSSAFYNETPGLERGDLIRYFNICGRKV